MRSLAYCTAVVSGCKLLTEFSREQRRAGGRRVLWWCMDSEADWVESCRPALIVCSTWGAARSSCVIIDRRMTQRMRSARGNLSPLLMAVVQTMAMPTVWTVRPVSFNIHLTAFIFRTARRIWFNDSVMDPRSNCREPATSVFIVLYWAVCTEQPAPVAVLYWRQQSTSVVPVIGLARRKLVAVRKCKNHGRLLKSREIHFELHGNNSRSR